MSSNELLARRDPVKFFNALMEGDPVAWGALGFGILIAGISWYFKSNNKV